MYAEQIFTLLMLIVAVLATALVVGSVRSYWRKLRAGPRQWRCQPIVVPAAGAELTLGRSCRTVRSSRGLRMCGERGVIGRFDAAGLTCPVDDASHGPSAA
jgi:hypothetical protein